MKGQPSAEVNVQYAYSTIQNIRHIPHFQELLEGVVKDFLVVVIEGKIFCQNATHQFSHKLAHPEFEKKNINI